jgi:hypothetical protein
MATQRFKWQRIKKNIENQNNGFLPKLKKPDLKYFVNLFSEKIFNL